MKPEPHLIGVIALMSLLALGGCGKSGPKADAQAKGTDSPGLHAIRQAGQPVTLAELNASYAEPPAGENGAPLYAEAFAALVGTDAKAMSFLAQNQSALALLHKAAGKSQNRYPIDLNGGFNTKLPHLTKIKTCAQLLSKATVEHTAKGQLDLARQDLADALRLAQSLEHEPVLISQLVRISADSTTQSALESDLGLKAFPAEQLASLQNVFAGREDTLRNSLALAFAAERCFAIALFQMPLSDYQNAAAAAGTNFPFGSPAEFDAYRRGALGQADFNLCLEYFSNWLAIVSAPFPGCVENAAQWTPQIEAQLNEAKSKGYRVAPVLLQSHNTTLERAADCVGQSRAAQAALAVERYRLASSSALPGSLNQLVPEFLPAIPDDPYDGKPLRYKKLSPKGYVIYSIGRNRQDDGGAARPSGGQADGPYDVTFAVRR